MSRGRYAVARLMEVEVTALCGAAPGERSPLRENQRNGYRERRCDTRAGTIGLAIRSCGRDLTFRRFSSPAGPPRRR